MVSFLRSLCKDTKVGNIMQRVITASLEPQKKLPREGTLSFYTLTPNWQVLHGHLTPPDVPKSIINHARLVTVVREPLERARAHYRYFREDIKRARRFPWFPMTTMTEEEFILHPYLTNFQSRWIMPLAASDFHIVGKTEDMQRFVQRLNPQAKTNIYHLYQGYVSQRDLPKAVIAQFKEQNVPDYALYNAATSTAS